MREGPKPGTRVRLVRQTDSYSKLQPGALGTVFTVDSSGTVHVNWDSGERLGLIVEAGDRWEEIK